MDLLVFLISLCFMLLLYLCFMLLQHLRSLLLLHSCSWLLFHLWSVLSLLLLSLLDVCFLLHVFLSLTILFPKALVHRIVFFVCDTTFLPVFLFAPVFYHYHSFLIQVVYLASHVCTSCIPGMRDFLHLYMILLFACDPVSFPCLVVVLLVENYHLVS